MNILRTADYAALPWKNGLGVSQVIASQPPAAGYDTVLWQLGTTQIGADCPFSSLPGMDRQFTLLQGDGVELTCVDAGEGVNLRKAVDAPFVPFAFRGDWRTDCRLLGGVSQVLNVMTRRGRATAAVRIQRWSGALLCRQQRGETLLGVILSGTAGIAGEAAPLVPSDTLLLDALSGEDCAINAPGAGARIAIVRLSIL